MYHFSNSPVTAEDVRVSPVDVDDLLLSPQQASGHQTPATNSPSSKPQSNEPANPDQQSIEPTTNADDEMKQHTPSNLLNLRPLLHQTHQTNLVNQYGLKNQLPNNELEACYKRQTKTESFIFKNTDKDVTGSSMGVKNSIKTKAYELV